MEFPTLVYRDKGPHQRPGGTFNCMGASDGDHLQELFTQGWFLSLREAIASKHDADVAPEEPKSIATEEQHDDNAPPTRDELEAKANELGIKFDGRTSDAGLAKRIEDALSEA